MVMKYRLVNLLIKLNKPSNSMAIRDPIYTFKHATALAVAPGLSLNNAVLI